MKWATVSGYYKIIIIIIIIIIMITIKNPGSVIVLTREEADKLGIEAKDYQQRLDIETVGPWNIVKSVKGLCVITKYIKGEGFNRFEKESMTLLGTRTMTNPRQGGYVLEGRVSIKGKKYSAYTSAIDVSIDDAYIQVGVISARYYEFPKN